eukprot:Gregarina_sp_Poly_1__10939@NODE_85_length_15275_cov_135_187336_g73_i0_p1_GENE_NODE_85_length_15275_cov_135_187336_g73_i0NODE_85_length_15275_cov_135_187336_g73_i0_p1_ORF_typecomplete_len1047_score157_63Cse1/PF08506_10/3_2e45Cse1/PF08506_10/1_5e03CAS_CSE1/PF03378_15/3_1e02CAS_CSE1/PF03378_15/5_1e34IBN_N/PF03810_19/0_00044Xpo1/PF08389_12/0_043Xpo1/PF08389_12/43Xpo1/PF08389_12/1_3e04Xpo1/PF08389_12/3_8e02Arm_2/PF04826_13/1_1e03Arm_2/PF04826_13/2e03Arm_2/PF04826_13/1Adaptin_N/PF01602_20/7Adaptin_N/P
MDAQVIAALRDSISQDPIRLRTGGELLATLIDSEQARIVEALCRVILAGSGSVDDDIRLISAIFLKNTVRARWDLHDDPKGLQGPSRDILKAQIIPMIMNAPHHMKIQLFDVLKQMTREDFPVEWPELLSFIVDQYYKPFLTQVGSGVVPTSLNEIANAVMIVHETLSKYERAERSEDILRALKGILQTAERPLFMMYCYCAKAYVQLIAHPTTSTAAMGQENVQSPNGREQYICVISQMATASLEIIKFLHGVDLPAFFEDNLAELSHNCFALLRAPPYPAADLEPRQYLLENTDNLSLSDAMRISCCELIHEYVVKYSEEYSVYVAEASKCLLTVLQGCSSSSSQDLLVASAMSAVASIANVLWGPEVNLAAEIPNFLELTCRDIILKNVPIREDDVEALEDDPLQFARDAWEGNQRGARRDGVLQLIKALLSRHEHDVRSVLLNAINELLMQAQSSMPTAGQKYLVKEAATFLIVAISVKTSTVAKGITEVYDLAPILDFLESQIIPALEDDVGKCNTSESVLFRCAAIKYVCSFRHIIPTAVRTKLLPLIVAHVIPSNVLIHTTAAATLERLLSAGLDGAPLFNFNDAKIVEQLEGAIVPLMLHIKGDVTTMDNEYVMKCLWKIMAVIRVDTRMQAARLRQLTDTLRQVSAKPVNPIFCHYLFETVAVVSRSVAKQLPTVVEKRPVHLYVIESMNQIISEEESHAFVPYCYQILGGLLDTIPMSPNANEQEEYKQAFGELYLPVINAVLVKERWTASVSNVPGILSLLSMVVARWWLWGDVLKYRLEEFIRLFIFCIGHKKVPPKASFEFLYWLIAFFPASAFATHTAGLLMPILQLVERTYRRSSPSSPIILFALVGISGMMLKFDLSVNSRLGHFDVQYPAEIDIVGILEARKPGVVCDFLRSIFLQAGENASQPKDKRMLLAGTLSFLSHPVVKQTVEIRNSLWVLAGILSGAIDREALLGSQRSQKEGSSPADDRDEFLSCMAAQDEQGGVDASAVYNRLASASRTAQINPLLTIANDQLLKQGLSEVQIYIGATSST